MNFQPHSKVISLATTFLLAAWLCLGAQSQDSHVFVHNQPMELGRTDNSVSVVHFFRLLDEKQRKRLKLTGKTLIVEDGQGQKHELSLTSSRRLEQWGEALSLLGYEKNYNQETGITDYFLAGAAAAKTEDKTAQLDSAEHREKRSLRRPGYRKAKRNYEKILFQVGAAEDTSLKERVDRLGQRIAVESPLSNLLWNFEVIQTPVPNALCTGEGHVIVTTGLLDLELTDDELAGVLGHEVAHGVRRHAEIYEERFNEYLAIQNGVQELRREMAKPQDSRNKSRISQLQSRLKNKEKRYDFIVNYLKNKKDYDQDEEEEADVLGMQYAVAAGFDPEGEARALIKLKKRSVQLFGQSYNKGSRTHPPLERRLQILETVRRRWREERR